MCLFKSATQKAKSGSSVDLGQFSRWGDRAGQKSYRDMMFENGLSCWNGPARSLHVHFECDSETKILDVSEPEKCEYYMNVKTPAVCPNSDLQVV